MSTETDWPMYLARRDSLKQRLDTLDRVVDRLSSGHRCGFTVGICTCLEGVDWRVLTEIRHEIRMMVPEMGDSPPATAHCPRCGQWPRVEKLMNGWNLSCRCEEDSSPIGGIAPKMDAAIRNWNMAVSEEVSREQADTPEPVPCPRCGNAASYWRKDDVQTEACQLKKREVWTVGCAFCIQPNAAFGVADDRDMAIDRWNKAVCEMRVRMRDAPEALPCPACGVVVSCWRIPVEDGKSSGLWRVGCLSTDCSSDLLLGTSDDSKVEAIKEWNKIAIQAKAVSEEASREQVDVPVALPSTLPCPVCFNLPSCGRDDDTQPWTVECMVCRSGDHVGVSDDKAAAIDSWNDAVQSSSETPADGSVLLPCPSCGKVATCWKDNKMWEAGCEATYCDQILSGRAGDKNGAIREWNKLFSGILSCPTCNNLPSCERKDEGAGPWRVGCMTCPSVLGRVGISNDRVKAVDAWNDAVRSVQS